MFKYINAISYYILGIKYPYKWLYNVNVILQSNANTDKRSKISA